MGNASLIHLPTFAVFYMLHPTQACAHNSMKERREFDPGLSGGTVRLSGLASSLQIHIG